MESVANDLLILQDYDRYKILMKNVRYFSMVSMVLIIMETLESLKRRLIPIRTACAKGYIVMS